MHIAIWLIIFVVSLIVLVKSADLFTDLSAKLGLALGLSSFVIGVTIVALGTSLPELITSLVAVIRDNPVAEFTANNVIGSNIANALLVIGLAAIAVGTLKVKKELIDVDLPFFFISTALFVLFILDGTFTRTEGIVSLLLFFFFLFYTATQRTRVKNGESVEKIEKALGEEPAKPSRKKEKITVWLLMGVVASVVGIFLGAKYFVDSVLTISTLLGWSSNMLTLSAVALGTSLPEVVTSVIAARRGEHGIAIGNAFGSNIFNALFIMGIPSLFTKLTVAPEAFTIGIPFLIVSTFAVIFVTFDNKVRFWEGGAMLLV